MRHFSVFLLATLFPLIFMGCKSEEDSYPPIHYGYNLAFVDENGNDLIEVYGSAYTDYKCRLFYLEEA